MLLGPKFKNNFDLIWTMFDHRTHEKQYNMLATTKTRIRFEFHHTMIQVIAVIIIVIIIIIISMIIIIITVIIRCDDLHLTFIVTHRGSILIVSLLMVHRKMISAEILCGGIDASLFWYSLLYQCKKILIEIILTPHMYIFDNLFVS